MKNQITMEDVAADRVNHAYRHIGGGVTVLLYDDDDTSQDAEYTATSDGQYTVKQGSGKKQITETEFNSAFSKCPYFFEYDDAAEEYKTIARDPAEEPHPFYYPGLPVLPANHLTGQGKRDPGGRGRVGDDAMQVQRRARISARARTHRRPQKEY